MRKLILVLAAVTVSLLVSGVPATAAEAPSPLHALSARFKGTSTFDFSTAGCSFVHQTFDATFPLGPGRSGSFSITGCADFGSSGFDYAGTFFLTTASGNVVAGSVTGVIDGGGTTRSCSSGTAVPIDLTLQPSPGRPEHLVGTWCSPAVPDTPGPISGELSGL